MQRINLLSHIYSNQMSEKEADDILSNFYNSASLYVSQYLALSDNDFFHLSIKERICYLIYEIALKQIAKWRYEGWPTSCLICKEEIKFDEDWAPIKYLKYKNIIKRSGLVHWSCYSIHLRNLKKDVELYLKFEDEIGFNVNDKRLIVLLNCFQKEDFLDYEILFSLIAYKRINLLNYLYKKETPFSYVSQADQATLLHVACGAGGYIEAVKFLFENNICKDVNALTDENESPFLLAVMYDHDDIVEYCFKHAKPDLTIKSNYGDTVFSLAQKNNNKKILSLLNEHAAL